MITGDQGGLRKQPRHVAYEGGQQGLQWDVQEVPPGLPLPHIRGACYTRRRGIVGYPDEDSKFRRSDFDEFLCVYTSCHFCLNPRNSATSHISHVLWKLPRSMPSFGWKSGGFYANVGDIYGTQSRAPNLISDKRTSPPPPRSTKSLL